MRQTISLLKWISWGGFGAASLALVLVAAAAPWWLQLLVLGISFLSLLGLLLLYNKALATWRAVLCAWLVYALLRVLSAGLADAGAPLLEVNLASLTAVLSLEAMITALAALLILAIRRDVSVAYVVLSYGLGAWLVLQMVRSAGGVLKFLTASLAMNASNVLSLSGPVVVSLSCMASLGFLTFFPHLVWMVIREARGR